ncbi:hypothetical protein FA048_19530 [Pedobacter polaris]|uniref:Uncharacterized protein n=1 Tax=Pedobacter polaris TaxID=2571273 RepID=A0A4V5NYM2_9SPHI|nr:hypothetical protein [Pedobacter polaris]TKC04533.1 hypothetical protein FA048_19530 [Pedobacter polaris]
MWKQLANKNKNMVFFGAVVVVLYIAYNFSFKHTFDAIVLNHQLKKEQVNDQAADGSFPQINRKNKFYLSALKSYKVKKEDRENRLWQAVSGMALGNDIEISFNPNPLIIADTMAVQNGIVSQQFAFKGNYFNLVKLLDTISKADGIGKVSDLKLSTKKDNQSKADENLNMQLTLVGIEK